ncbi:low molecular weight phosphotyrosine protein phosphatase [Gordonia sp. X0973]|uniref:low molecular weight protein-tyrosine-phosphatase n=1 Tax=Gordonia sp. X0973 TaxID=2742602 RepID=UPI000F52C32C|nr:low molecular weight protein-tyrosine-phosphatase [Gordonia sp. X0973]QKT07652.1 low molecular weight phosphotyrosine protein phosphatase [Gordonia sp. X0973]
MTEKLLICVVCTGNICRSPMGQNILRHALAQEGLADRVDVVSAGTSGWHVGDAADNRARTELLAHGYPDDHVAAQVGPRHFDADLILAMDAEHVRALERKRLGERVRLVRSFDPDAEPDADVPDPYYGTQDDFAHTRELIEAAVPGILEWVRTRLRESLVS